MRRSRGWRHILALALTLAASVTITSVVSPATAQAQSGAIREINVTGNKRVEPETVRTYLKFNVGDAYDPAKVDASIKALFATGLFSDVRIDREGAGVLITVVENPVVNQVAFEGNKEVEKTTLDGEVQLKPRAVFTRAKVQADVQRILDVYRRQGRFAASVEPKLIELDSNRVNLVFEIQEGAATKVKAINFIGNRAFSDSQLRDIITTNQSGLFDFIKGTNIYDPDRLSLDRELLRQYYLKNGFADIRIVSAGAELDRDGSGFYITFVVDEGELFNFGRVEIDSPPVIYRRQGALRRAADAPRRHLQPVADGQDGREARRSTFPSKDLRSPASGPRRRVIRALGPSTSPTRSTRVRASTSSASTSTATCAPAITSSGASSAWPRATRSIR